MSDAPRQEHPEDARDDAPARPQSAPGEADAPRAEEALGAWGQGFDEESTLPAEPDHAHDRQNPAPDAPKAQDGEARDVESDTRTREELLDALTRTVEERDEYLDGVRRARAEFENFRKRSMREGATQREAGKAEVADGLLEVLDDLERTLDAAEASEDQGLARGVQLVAEKLVGALRAAGLERVGDTGVPFDPNLHEAVQQLEAEEPREDPIVTQVLRPGYTLGERVLRAAMVVVEQ